MIQRVWYVCETAAAFIAEPDRLAGTVVPVSCVMWHAGAVFRISGLEL